MQTLLVEKLRQWELAGGKVRIVRLSQIDAVVELCTCTGELMERFSSRNQAVVDDLRLRMSMAGLDDSMNER